MAQQPVDITHLSLPELQDLQEQVANEVNTCMQNIVALQQTAGRFATAGQSIEFLSEREQGQPVLLPLTESLYVSGTLESVDTVLLEIGTGYFVERDAAGGIDYCKRKVTLVRDKLDQLGKIVQSRQVLLQQIASLVAEKAAAAAAAQQRQQHVGPS